MPKTKTVKAASPVDQTIKLILERAVKAGASDVHIEPRAGFAVVRQRVNGLLQVSTKLPGASFGSLVAQLKSSAGLDEKKRRTPQNGRYRVTLSRRPYDVDVNILPVLDGERVALHLNVESQTTLSLVELGFWGSALELLTVALTQRHGLVLVASSDDSAPLTLHGLLNVLVGSHLHVATVEQRLLYHLPSAKQTLVKQEIGMTFSRRLKQVLREQPDVVMVSDVFDKATAQTLAQASDGQQLILAGLHATGAAACLVGFNQLAAEPSLVGSNLLVTVSQKLVPSLCRECREAYTPDHKLQAKLTRIFGLDDKGRMQRLHELEREAAASFGGGSELSSDENGIRQLWRAKAAGCPACNHTGYQHRLLIVEIVPVTPPLQAGLLKKASASQLRAIARTNGMLPLAQDALVKALRGLLPIETVLANTLTR